MFGIDTISAALKAGKAALDTWNAERGKAAQQEHVQLGMEVARAKDNEAAAKAAKRVAEVMTEQMDDDDIDALAAHLAAERDRRKSGT